MQSVSTFLKLIRWKHYLKNVLLFLPFALSTTYEISELLNLGIGFIAFSAIASCIYIINDIKDIDADREHITKRFRPLASGKFSVKSALVWAMILAFLAFSLGIFLKSGSVWFLLTYFVLNLAYTNLGKKIRFVDILFLSSFYLIRVFFGAHISSVEVTTWFIATLSVIFITLALNKRYMELANSKKEKLVKRDYEKSDLPLLQNMMHGSSLVSLVFLNIHAYSILGIKDVYFFAGLNLLAIFVILNYFDTRNNSEDPVSRIARNKLLIVSALVLLAMYVYYLNQV